LRVIIPGASGFIGKNLLTNVPHGWDIVATYNTDKSFLSFVEGLHSNKIVAEKCDFLNLHDLESLKRKCGAHYNLCIYLLANSDPSKSVVDPSFDLRCNTESLINFLQLFRINQFIFFSSGAVYEGHEGVVFPDMPLSPTLPYTISKLASEAYIRHFRKKGAISKYLIVRFFGAYGPYEPSRKVYTKLVKQFYFDRGEEFSIRGNGLNLIDAMYVDDAVEGILRMANASLEDTVIDFCGGAPITIQDLVLKAAEIFGITKPKIVQKGETAEYNKFYANSLPFTQRYGFKPKTGLAEGLHKLAKFLEGKQK